MDYRGHKTWHRPPLIPNQLGTKQWEDLKQSFKQGGRFKDCKAAIIISTIPIVVFSNPINKLGEKISDDLKEHWQSENLKEQGQLLDLFSEWKAGGKEIVLVGGDIHVGGHTKLYQNGTPKLSQLITSGIANIDPSFLTKVGYKLFLELYEKLGNGWEFEHFNFKFKQTYGVVRLEKKGDTVNSTMQIISQDHGKSAKEEKVILNEYDPKTTASCCTIF